MQLQHANLSLIVAKDNNNTIGYRNNLLWHLPNDLLFFKINTLNKPIIMGTNTWNSLPFKPLPKRENIVLGRTLSQSPISQSLENPANLYCFTRPEDLPLERWGNQEIMVIGGGQIYQYFLPFAKKLYITNVDVNLDGDVFFPKVDLKNWQLISNENHKQDSTHSYDFSCNIYQKINT